MTVDQVAVAFERLTSNERGWWLEWSYMSIQRRDALGGIFKPWFAKVRSSPWPVTDPRASCEGCFVLSTDGRAGGS